MEQKARKMAVFWGVRKTRGYNEVRRTGSSVPQAQQPSCTILKSVPPGFRTLSAPQKTGRRAPLDLHCTRKKKEGCNVPTIQTQRLDSFYNLLHVLVFLSSLRSALGRLYSAFQLFIRLKVVQTDHLITARCWAFLLREPIRSKHLSYSPCRERVLTSLPK
jgi:hypothetical protein